MSPLMRRCLRSSSHPHLAALPPGPTLIHIHPSPHPSPPLYPPQVRVALLQANLARSGMEDGLVVLGSDMAAQLTAGLPECVPVAV